LKGSTRRLYREIDVGGTASRDLRYLPPRGGVEYGECLTRLRGHPLTVDEEMVWAR
jgi:hypothetical protein